MNTLKLDLKVCEGCGALWLRTTAGRVYCRRCAPLLADFPDALGLRRKPQAAAHRNLGAAYPQRHAATSLRVVSTSRGPAVEAGAR